MSKLAVAVAKAWGCKVLLKGELDKNNNALPCDCVVRSGHYMEVSMWLQEREVAKQLVDAGAAKITWLSDSWTACIGRESAQHHDWRKAVYMAFCKHKGMAYE